MPMPGRTYTAGSGYRYGFNGKENDNEVKGTGNQQDYGMRVYDPRLGRFLSTDPKEKVFVNQSPYCFASNNPIRFIDINGEGAGLDLKSLLGNPLYQGMTIADLRSMVRSANPGLEEFKVQISAGHLLENAYAEFSGFPKNREKMLAGVSFYGLKGVRPRWIKPDFVQPTQYTDGRQEITFPYGGFYEVTATSQTINLKIKDKQIEAYIDKLPYATNLLTDESAGLRKAAQLTLVLPYGAFIDPEVVKSATKGGVNLYVSYSFRNTETGAIVFSNPEKLNFKGRKEVPYPDIGDINKPSNPDAKKAAAIWKEPGSAESKTNEADN